MLVLVAVVRENGDYRRSGLIFFPYDDPGQTISEHEMACFSINIYISIGRSYTLHDFGRRRTPFLHTEHGVP